MSKNIKAELFLRRQASVQGSRDLSLDQRKENVPGTPLNVCSNGVASVHADYVPQKIVRAAEAPRTELPKVRPLKNSIGAVVIVAVLGLIALVTFFGGDDGESGVAIGDHATAGELIRATSPKVFAIITGLDPNGMLGSAFAVTRKDLVTNRHVVESVGVGSKIAVLNPKWGTTLREGIVRRIATDVDLAWIELAEPIESAPLTIARKQGQQGDGVFALGYPGYAYRASEVLEVTYSSGDLKAVNRSLGGMPCYETSAVINEGNSGGPLLNKRGEIVGINTFKIKDGVDGAYFAIKIEALKTAIPELWRKIH